MPQYLSPGVYVEEMPSTARPIAGVGTSTAGFMGVVANGVNMQNQPGKFQAQKAATASTTTSVGDKSDKGKKLSGTGGDKPADSTPTDTTTTTDSTSTVAASI